MSEERADQVGHCTCADRCRQHVGERVTVRAIRKVIEPKGGARRDRCSEHCRNSSNEPGPLLRGYTQLITGPHGVQNDREESEGPEEY